MQNKIKPLFGSVSEACLSRTMPPTLNILQSILQKANTAYVYQHDRVAFHAPRGQLPARSCLPLLPPSAAIRLVCGQIDTQQGGLEDLQGEMDPVGFSGSRPTFKAT